MADSGQNKGVCEEDALEEGKGLLVLVVMEGLVEADKEGGVKGKELGAWVQQNIAQLRIGFKI